MTTTITICLTIRDAVPDEAAGLEALQRRSSAVWEEYRAALTAHPDAIAIDGAAVADGQFRVACVAAGVVVGFSAVKRTSDGACELDGLFVEPAWMRRGVGRLLVADVIARERDRAVRRIDVVANPRAAGFYARLGFRDGAGATTRFGPAGRMHLAI